MLVVRCEEVLFQYFLLRLFGGVFCAERTLFVKQDEDGIMNVTKLSDFLLHEKLLFEDWCICGPAVGSLEFLDYCFLCLIFLPLF